MKIKKVCGYSVVNSKVPRYFILTGCLTGICGCTVSAKIPYQQTLYMVAYDFLRTAECQNRELVHTGYEECNRSYHSEYQRYRQHRDQYIKDLVHESSE